MRASYITYFCTGNAAVKGSKLYVDNSEIVRGKCSDSTIGRENQVLHLHQCLKFFSNSATIYCTGSDLERL
ncbi:hypothetical protein DVH24_039926 [Malus domestica]|uniref:Uncharacterized protein n=1 Tax=Malus domestica TaxID=3750 RepID=A0A498I7A7_MALDO|nr:hypothetical protein DVH24_039926 [Malus domestica]